jgi:ribosomal protein S27E
MLVSSGLVFFSSPVKAEDWAKIDMGKPDPNSWWGLRCIAVGDGDRDGTPEVYAGSYDTGHLFRFSYSNGSWSNEDITPINDSRDAWSILVGDADDDGQNEVYVSLGTGVLNGNHVYEYTKTANGWNGTDMGEVGGLASDFAVGDANRDGRTELYTASFDGHIYSFSKGASWSSKDIGYTINTYSDRWGYWFYPRMNGVAVGDGDNDGISEVYGAGGDNHLYRFNYSDANSSWNRTDMGTDWPTNDPYGSIAGVVVGDLDHDGLNEVYTAIGEHNSAVYRYSWDNVNGTWNRTEIAELGQGAYANRIRAGDGDSDAKDELYLGSQNAMVYRVAMKSDGSGWETSSVGSGARDVYDVAVGSGTYDPRQSEVYASSYDGHAYQFFKDRTPPANPTVWSDTHPVPGTWYNNSTVHVLWKDSGHDISGIDGYSVEWDGCATTVPDDTKEFEESVHDTNKTLADGASYFHIRARDNALNWNLSAAHFGPIWIDTVPPDSLNLTINGGAGYTSDRMVTLGLNATDPSPGSGIALASFSNDGTNWSDWENFGELRAGWDITDARYGGNDSDGMKYVHARVRDAAGNEIAPELRSSAGIFLDRVAPIALSIVINGGAPYTNSSDVLVELAADESGTSSGIDGMALSNDGTAWSGWMDWQNSTGWSLTSGAGGSDSDGMKQVFFRVRDRSGNIGGPATASVFLDRRSPENLSLRINDGAGYTNTSTVDLAVSASDPEPSSQLAFMELYNSERSTGEWENFSRSRSGWSLTDGSGGNDTDGNKTVYLKVRDRASNFAGPVNDSIFLDRVRPGPLSIMINGGATYTLGPIVNLTLCATDPEPASGVSAMQLSTDGVAWTDWEPFCVSKTFTLPAPDGTKTVYFRVRDRAWNVADATSAIIILDTAPPVISDVRVIGITDRSAIITWTTGEAADSGVDYGLTTGYGSSKLDTAFLTSHSVVLAGLSASTTYHFRVRSTDRAGNPPAYTGDLVFITGATPDTAPPEVWDVRVFGITDRLAVVSWATNEPADSTVEYGTDATLGIKLGDNRNFVLRHVMTLTGLSPSTMYYFQVASMDPSGNGPAKSGIRSFTTLKTPDVAPPMISNVRVSGVTDRLALVSWETDEPADGVVDFGATTAYGRTAGHAELLIIHELTLAGLSAGTTYHFRVGGSDATGNGPAFSADYSFTTALAPDTTPPSIQDLRFEAITGNSALVVWETDEPADGYVEYGISTAYGLSCTDTGYSIQHSQFLEGLGPDTVYHIRVRSQDPSGNAGASGDFVFRTEKNEAGPDTAAPVIFGANVAGITDTRAVVMWFTDEAADSGVDYGKSTAYGLRTSDPTYVLFHSVVLDGLRPSTEYHFRVRSSDVFGNGPALSGDIAFTTAGGPDVTPPGITNVRLSNVTDTTAVISWRTDEPASSFVEYGTTASYGRNITARIFVLEHSVRLTGLTPSTTYHFRVGSVDPSGNPSGPGADSSFTTQKSGASPGPGPGPNPGTPAAKTQLPWPWILFGILLVAVAVAVIAYRSRSRRRRQASAPPDESMEILAVGEEEEMEVLDTGPPAGEVVETVRMEEAGSQAPARFAAAARTMTARAGAAGPAASSAPAASGAVDWAAPLPGAPSAPVPVKHIRCPACRTRIPVYNDVAQEIECPVCGRRGPYRPLGKASPAGPGTPAMNARPEFAHAPEPSRYPALDALVSGARPAAPPAPPGLSRAAEPPPAAPMFRTAVSSRPAGRPAPRAGLTTMRCPACGGPITIYGSVFPVRFTCPSCGRVLTYQGPRNA